MLIMVPCSNCLALEEFFPLSASMFLFSWPATQQNMTQRLPVLGSMYMYIIRGSSCDFPGCVRLPIACYGLTRAAAAAALS